MKFTDIFYEGKNLSPVNQQNFISDFFKQNFDAIAENKMSLWNLNKDFPQDEVVFLLGVCPSWNYYDLYLLDCINDSLKHNSINDVVEVFDIDSIEDLNELWKLFGNIDPKQPPVLGVWNKGILQKSVWNWDAKTFLIEKFNFIWQP